MQDSPDDSTILGDVFLRAFVTIIDVENQQVGLASSAGCAVTTRRAIDRTTFQPRHPRHR
jgi:hypothetical protein